MAKEVVSQFKKRPLPAGVREEKLLDQRFSFFRSCQQMALAAVLKPDVAAVYRRICRWYSKNCSTPLHVVESLPSEYVLQAFFEERYRELEEQQLENARMELSRTDAERDGEDEDQEAFFREIEEQERNKNVDIKAILDGKAEAPRVDENDIQMAFKSMKQKDFE